MIAGLIKLYRHFFSKSLYRNSIYLILSTGVVAFFGFFFWIVNARIYTIEQVGAATTLLSIVGIISSFATLGLNNGLIRYLARSEIKNKKINSSLTITVIISVVASVIFLLGLPHFTPKLLFLQSNIFYILLFICFVVFATVNGLIESVFIAYRSSKFVFYKNIILSITKLLLPVLLLSFGVYGIFSSVGISFVIATLFSVVVLIRKFNYKIEPLVNIEAVNKIASFSFGNYIASFIGGLP